MTANTGSTGTQTEPVLKPPAPSKAPAAANASDASDTKSEDRNQAIALIRQKLAAIYGDEPDAEQELAEAANPDPAIPHSKHQQYMLSLQRSGKSATDIQAAWHTYYQGLNGDEKREVWQEFYNQSARARAEPSRLQPVYRYQEPPESRLPASQEEPSPVPTPALAAAATSPAATTTASPASASPPATTTDLAATAKTSSANLIKALDQLNQKDHQQNSDSRTPSAIRRQVQDTLSSRGKLQAKHHVQSLLFGLSFGAAALFIVMFSFFNEVVIAPIIQPSRVVNATPIIVSPDGITPSDKDEIIIPKINVQIPLDFGAKGIATKEFEAALDHGVAHYPITALPGQKGNASFFGHSSNNIFNPGKYKFAFVLLNELVPGDTFYITYNKVVYAYQVYDKKIVEATNVSILNPVADKAATAMLVTCDPPGTSLHRLAVWGEQVSPNPNSNSTAAASNALKTQAASTDLPGNGPTLWGRFVNWVKGDE